jgi:hypothetical protein
VLLRRVPPPAAPATQPPADVQIVLDSRPQGATVTADATTPAAGPRRVGQTPLLLRLPRGDAAVALTLTREGFAPLAFRVLPNRDKDLVVTLERASAETPATVDAPAVRHPKAPAMRHVASGAAPVSPAPAPAADTMATVRFRDDAGDGFHLVEARFVMDDRPLPVLTAVPPAEDTVIYAGRVRPGRHVVSARLVYQGRNRGPFTYLAGYRVNVQSRKVVDVPGDRPASFTIATEKAGGLNVPLEKQLAVTFRDDSARAVR